MERNTRRGASPEKDKGATKGAMDNVSRSLKSKNLDLDPKHLLVKGHLENLQKFIHFGQDRLPLAIPLLVLSKTCLGDFVKTQTHAASINAE